MITAVVGGQFGSEGKGLIVGKLAPEYAVHVRVGAANAGHTVYTGQKDEIHGPEKHVMQQVPCAAYANPKAKLVLGPGALISANILEHEMDRLIAWRKARGLKPPTLYVDHRAHVILPDHVLREEQTDLAKRIGSTSTIAKEGIGPAQADRVMRSGWQIEQFYHANEKNPPAWMEIIDAVQMLREADAFDTGILLEGTQGTGLSLITGGYPYVTSRNTTATGLAGDCGIGPLELDRVIMVCRSYPIRVAGNSGPFHRGSAEIDWEVLGIDPENERTTVTKKVRRVATISYEQLKEAAWLNSATEIALTFADYLNPAIAGMQNDAPARPEDFQIFAKVKSMIDGIEASTGVPVTMVGTGPHSVLRRASTWVGGD